MAKSLLRFIKRRPLVSMASLVLLVILIPYLVSRVLAPFNCVRVHASVAFASETDYESSSLKLVVFNMAHGRGTADDNWQGGTPEVRRKRLVKIANVLKQYDADLVLLQEVDFDSSWSHGINQAEFLASEAGFPVRIEQRNLDFRVLRRTYRFGNAILSKLPLNDAVLVDLPSYAAWESLVAGKKRALQVDVIWNKQKIRVVNAHLSHRSEKIRVDSATMISEDVNASPFPYFIGGDFNSTPSGFPGSNADHRGKNAIDIMDDNDQVIRSPTELPAEHQLTFSTDSPKSVIDWMMIPSNWQYEHYQVIDTGLSDHRMIFCQVTPTVLTKTQSSNIGNQ